MAYTLAVLGGTKNENEVDKDAAVLKISIPSSDLDNFTKEDGTWRFQDTGETVGVKVINFHFLIQQFSGANVPIGLNGQRFVYMCVSLTPLRWSRGAKCWAQILM